ncbi:MFS transporter [Ottowia sp.]|uniref:MFS transporter n=1 Tax=Ottowia sp. TaxID=1898956 RepID=UPI002D0D3EE6|nr:MFS transporter [Ottowia sp.]HRN75817.1 MFS transporter [Ottowia sp.]HRQ04229.1 MFS transporter [Ottowia sp.]
MTTAAPDAAQEMLPRRAAVAVFLAFALAYFFSALLRAVTATLSPVLTAEFSLHARDLGLLAGGYFLGFAAMQLPLGAWLDRHGPKKVILGLLTVAVLGCVVFAVAGGFAGLMAARLLMGAGVAACLMAPLTGYRRWFDAGTQLRANAWMLMTGSLGMLASTLPVQWLLPVIGWRGVSWVVAALIAVAMGVIVLIVPRWRSATAAPGTDAKPAAQQGSYADIARNAYFRHATPLGMVCFGGMVAIQSLWAGPWMTRVSGATPLAAATGLFWINLSMLVTFWSWGMLLPRMTARGISVDSLVARIQPFSFAALALLVLLGPAAGGWSFVLLALYCVLTTPSAQVQPVVALAFPSHLAGRVLSAYNLVIFVGIFLVQWGIGLGADAFEAVGWSAADALRGAMGAFGALSLACWLHFVLSGRR